MLERLNAEIGSLQQSHDNHVLNVHVDHAKAKLYYQIATMALQTPIIGLIKHYFSEQSNRTIYNPIQPSDDEGNGFGGMTVILIKT